MNFRVLLISLFLFSSVNPVIVKNSTNKKFFVVTTYKDSIIRTGYEIKPGKKRVLDRISSVEYGSTEYFYPEILYFFESSDHIIFEETFGKRYRCEINGYEHSIRLDPLTTKVNVLSSGRMFIFICKR